MVCVCFPKRRSSSSMRIENYVRDFKQFYVTHSLESLQVFLRLHFTPITSIISLKIDELNIAVYNQAI